MKKIFVIATFALVAGFFAVSCSSTNLETDQVGWSGYTSTVVKDYNAVGIVKASSTEKITKTFFNKNVEGSRVLYAQLMDEAAKLGANDIINIRIDRKKEKSSSSKTTVYTYTATAVAIKYKDYVAPIVDDEPVPVLGNEKTNSVREAGPDIK